MRLWVISLLVVVVIGLLGWAITSRWSPEWGGEVLAFCAGINLAACWVSFVPVVVVQRRCRSYIPQAVLGAMTIRILLVASAMLIAMTVGRWAVMPLSAWMIVFYLALLAVETGLTVRLLNPRCEPEKGTASV